MDKFKEKKELHVGFNFSIKKKMVELLEVLE